LLAVPVLVLGFALAFARRHRALARLGDHPLIVRMTQSVSVARKVWRAALTVVALALMVLALARPQAGGRSHLEKPLGLDIIVALDFSKSMLAKDIYPSRLERAKRELERLLDSLAGDRVGLVAFAGETLSYPATTDYDAIKLFWRDLSPADMPVGGTAIGRALRAGIDMLSRLRSQGGETRDQIILLLTDGEDTESQPLAMADEAAKLGIKIYSVGIGSRSGELVPEPSENQEATGFIKDKDGKYVTSRLDESLLSQLAQKTSGGYLRADAQNFGVEAVTSALSGLKRTASEARLVKHYNEIFELLLLPAFLLLALEFCLSERRRKTVPAALVFLFALPFLGAWNPLERKNPAVEQGNTSMKAGKADEALSHYESALSQRGGDPGIHYNRGNALFSLSRFDESSQEFLRATQGSPPQLKTAAFYNLGNSYFKLNKYDDAIAAYRQALTLDPTHQRAKWNLELAQQQKKKEEEQKKNENKDQDKKDDKKDQDKKDDKQDDKKDQDKKDDKQDDKKDQDKKDQPQKPEEPKPEPQKQEPAKEEKAPELKEIDSVLDQLEKSPKDLEKMRAQLRAIRRAPPVKDW
jgi:Ca-activated chloride channel family protein